MEIIGIELGQIFHDRIIYFMITTFVGAILLHIATGILNFEKRRFTTAFAVVIVGGIISFILTFIPVIGWLLGLITYWYFIKNFYIVGWGCCRYHCCYSSHLIRNLNHFLFLT